MHTKGALLVQDDANLPMLLILGLRKLSCLSRGGNVRTTKFSIATNLVSVYGTSGKGLEHEANPLHPIALHKHSQKLQYKAVSLIHQSSSSINGVARLSSFRWLSVCVPVRLNPWHATCLLIAATVQILHKRCLYSLQSEYDRTRLLSRKGTGYRKCKCQGTKILPK